MHFTYLRPEHPVVVQSVKDVVDTNWTANSSIETENKEELLIFPAHTVTKKETMMVENIDASPKPDLTWRNHFKSKVRTCSRDSGEIEKEHVNHNSNSLCI